MARLSWTPRADKDLISAHDYIAKDSPRIEAYGNVDELNAVLGLVRKSNREEAGPDACKARIDAILQRASKNWRLERMARVDRNVLRLATWELRFAPEVPAKVVINEAIEVARRFGAAESPAFVNGLLDRIAQELKRQ